MKHEPEALWLTMALEKESKTIHVIGVATTKDESEALARTTEHAEKPMVCVNVTGKPGAFINKLSLWLADNDIVGSENTDTIRGIVQSIKETMMEIDKSTRKKRKPLR